MPWQILISLQTFFAAGQILTMRSLARTAIGNGLAAFANAVAFVIMYAGGLMWANFHGGSGNAYFHAFWWIYIGSAVGFALLNICNYKALSYMDSAGVSILNTSAVLFTIVVAVLLLHEHLSIHELVGIGVLLLSIWYILSLELRAGSHRNRNVILGASFVLASAIIYSFAISGEKYLLSQVSMSTFLVYGWGLQTAVMTVLALPQMRRGIRALQDVSVRQKLAGLGITRLGQGLFFVAAQIATNNVALVNAIANFRVVLVTLFAGLLLHETRKWIEKVIAASIAVAALIIIFL